MRAFNDIFVDCTCAGTKVPKEKYLENGKNIIVDQGQNIIAGYTNLEDGLYTDVPAIIFGDHTRIIKYVDIPFFLGADGVKLLKSKDSDANYKYLYYALKNARIPDTGYNRHFKWLKEVKIEYPDSNVQKKVVNILDKISKIIGIRKKVLEKLDNLIKARFVEMFYDKNYPKSTISELAIDKVSSVKKDFQPSDIIKYIDISSIDNEKNIMTGYTEYVLSKAPSRAQQHIIKDDIVISTVRPNLHNVAMTTYTDNNLVASSGFCVLRAVKCIPEYLMAIVVSDNFTDAMSKIVTGANYPAIKNSDIMNYIVSVPPIEKQEEFASFVKQIDKSKFVKINLVICKNIIYYRISWFF